MRRVTLLLGLVALILSCPGCERTHLKATLARALLATNVVFDSGESGSIALRPSEADTVRRLVRHIAEGTGIQVHKDPTSAISGRFFFGDVGFAWFGDRLSIDDADTGECLSVRDPILGDMAKVCFRAVGNPPRQLDRAEWESVLSVLAKPPKETGQTSAPVPLDSR